jgi:hypothetical protein
MKRLTKISPLAGYRLAVAFEDGVTGIIALESELCGPVFAPLRDESVFSQVSLDEFGAPCWPNGADLAPDAIYARLTGRPVMRTPTREGKT